MGGNVRLRSCLGFMAVMAMSVLTACAGQSNASSSSTCPEVVRETPTMISPANGATGVADGNFSLILSNSGFTIDLTAPNVATVVLPSPAPASQTQTGVSYAVPALQAATTYSVVASTAATSGPCGSSPAAHVSIGTFTTQ